LLGNLGKSLERSAIVSVHSLFVAADFAQCDRALLI